ncbi:phosphate ABC transporter permease subunit PstC [Mucilaginibacter corticis]|uniref:Phosphate transport system permease protein n=1 Tax=Mucilaginibacter corticis TaxID=2597670 RepID=A0A556MK84_9SPHI|nr:phosphate ABC transporter permease subunit PstC [Mucilaginibacter corticis]
MITSPVFTWAGNCFVNKPPNFVENKRLELSNGQLKWETMFKLLLKVMSVLLVLIIVGVLITLIIESWPSITSQGIKYIWGKVWDPVQNIYGAYPFLVGTLLTSFTALIISIPFSYAIAIYLGEYNPKGWLSDLLKNTIELIAAVPSIIYGFWGLFVLVPLVRTLEMKLDILPYGVGVFTASIVLAVMIIPYGASLGITLIRMVPSPLKEGAYALGATRWEVIRNVIMPYTRSGLFAGVLLSLGRALGETMAVTMLIGNTTAVADTFKNVFFGPGNTMASVIANEFAEADHTLYLSALIELGLVLFVVTVIINMIGKRIITRVTKS